MKNLLTKLQNITSLHYKLIHTFENNYLKQITSKNYITIQFAAIITALIELTNILITVFFTDTDNFTTYKIVHLYFYFLLIFSAFIIILAERFFKNNLKLLYKVQVLSAFFYTAWCLGLNSYEIHLSSRNSTLIYVSAILVITIVLKLKFFDHLWIILLSSFIFIFFNYSFIPLGDLKNLLITLIIAIFGSALMYFQEIDALYRQIKVDRVNYKLRKNEDDLRLSLEKYNLIIDAANLIVFDYNFNTDALTFSKNIGQLLNCKNQITNGRSWFYKSTFMEIEKKMVFSKLIKVSKDKQTENNIDIPILVNSTTQWYNIHLYYQYSKNKKIHTVLGICRNIDKQKNLIETLSKQTMVDPLTGAFNRSGLELEANNLLKEDNSTCVAMLIIDLDNFKHINDTYGHPVGDLLLISFTSILSEIFRKTDYVARLGGDEFAVIMHNISSIEIITSKMGQLLKRVNNLSVEHNISPTSCSIGIYLDYSGNSTFDNLYKNADKALYQSKNSGKNTYTIIDSLTDEGSPSLL